MSGLGLFLFRKDPALKGLLASVPILTGIGLAIRFAAGEKIGELSAPGWSGFTIFMFAVVWCVTVFHTAGTGFWSRCNRIALALPIPARKLWIVRNLAVTVAVALPVAGLTIALGAGGDRSLFLLGGKVLAVLLLLLAIGQSPFPKLFRVPVSAVYIVFLVFLAFLAMIYLLITPSSIVTILLPAGLALLIFVLTVLAVPRGFLAAPNLPGQSDGAAWWKWLEPPDLAASPAPAIQDAVTAAGTPATAPGLSYRQVLHMTLFRTVVNRFQVWFIGLVMAFVSFAILYKFATEQGNWLPMTYTSIWILAHFQQSPRWIGPLAPLPIRRTLLFRYVVGSLLLPMLAGGIFGLLIVGGEKPVLVNLEQRGGIDLQVPYEFWETGRAGDSPEAVSPWGEKLQLPAHTITKGARQMVFNPYAVGADSSDRFIAWQQARAIQAVYGLNRLPDLNAPQVPAGARSRLHHRTWGLGLFLNSMLLVAGLVLCLQQPRRKAGRFLVAALLPTLGGLLGLVILAMLIGPAFGVTSMEAIDALPLLLLGRLAASIGISGGAYLVLATLVLIAGYGMVGRVFRKVEPDRTPTRTPWHDYRF